ncbi:MAG: histidine phosphatase family protein [Candidatus Limnocylindrales bacterium]
MRHGESTWVAEGRFQGQGDPPLSDAGLRQAALAAARLARPHVAPALPVPLGPPLEIAHSPLRRTTQTAMAVAAALTAGTGFGVAAHVRPEPGLLEIGQGEWEGLPGAEVESRWSKVIAGWRRDPLTTWAPGGESIREVDVRVRTSLEDVLGRLGDRGSETSGHRSHVLGYGEPPSRDPWSILVGHDGVFKVTMLALMGLPLERFWSFPFALCGISVVEFRGGRPRLRAHNLIDHLAPLDDEHALASEAERNRSGAL